LVTVIVAEGCSRFNATDTPAGRITKKKSASVSVRWALGRLNSRDLVFTFEEKDRETLLSLSPKQLLLAAKTTGEDVSTHKELEALLLPVKKKPKISKPKPKTTKSKAKTPQKEE